MKYKNKYIELKNQMGSSIPLELPSSVDFLITIDEAPTFFYINNNDPTDIRLPGWKLCDKSNKFINNILFNKNNIELQKKNLIELSKCQKKGTEMKKFINSIINNIKAITFIEETRNIEMPDGSSSNLIHILLDKFQNLSIEKFINKDIKMIELVETELVENQNKNNNKPPLIYKLHKPYINMFKTSKFKTKYKLKFILPE